MNKKTQEDEPQESLELHRGDIFGYYSDWHSYSRIAKSKEFSLPGHRRFGQVVQGMNFIEGIMINLNSSTNTITNCGLIFNK